MCKSYSLNTKLNSDIRYKYVNDTPRVYNRQDPGDFCGPLQKLA